MIKIQSPVKLTPAVNFPPVFSFLDGDIAESNDHSNCCDLKIFPSLTNKSNTLNTTPTLSQYRKQLREENLKLRRKIHTAVHSRLQENSSLGSNEEYNLDGLFNIEEKKPDFRSKYNNSALSIGVISACICIGAYILFKNWRTP